MSGKPASSFVGSISFRLLGDADHRLSSYAEINSSELYSSSTQLPVHGGVQDTRLGTTEHSYRCETCMGDKKYCNGHPGHMELRVSVPNPVGIEDIRRWLRVICLECGHSMINPAKLPAAPSKRLKAASKIMTDGKPCPNCKAVHPKIMKDDEDRFTFRVLMKPATAEAKNKATDNGVALSYGQLHIILGRISAETVDFFGRSDSPPENLTLRVVKVPPVTIRPGLKNYGGSGSSYHDATNLYQHMCRRVQQLPSVLPAVPDGDLLRQMQNLYQIYFDLIIGSSSTNVMQGSSGKRGLVIGGRPVNSLLRNLPQKDGRIRGNLLRKRVFFISRSTISGCSQLRPDEIGLPLEFARTLQVCETVQEFNIIRLSQFFLNGRKQYPGCTTIVRKATGETYDVSGLRDTRLEVGDMIYRDVVDGDLAFFNRQPSLERSSIGVHKVVVITDPSIGTFQMNVLACEWYNADFDGDQMNLWAAREPAARAEAGIMSSVANWFISTKSSGPVTGQVQDSTIGSYVMTKSGVVVNKFHAMQLFANTGMHTLPFKSDTYTGREIASMIFKDTPINYKRAPSSFNEVYTPFIDYDKDEVMTVMEHGVLIKGVLDKKAIGAKAEGGLYHLISRAYGSQKALDSIYVTQQVVLQFLMWKGFTVGVSDLLPSADDIDQIRLLVDSVKLESNEITTRLLRGEIVAPIDGTVHDFYEQQQLQALKVDEMRILRWIFGANFRPESNGFFQMIACGAKGINPNLISVSGVIGQTSINNERMAENFSYRRTLVFFERCATDPAAYGFVQSCYMSGMCSSEFIFQMMNGRYDLINKALTTSVTGYFMRKGIMNNQSAIVNNHRQVVKGNMIVEFLYGEDGFDSRELEKVKFNTALLSDKAVLDKTGVDREMSKEASNAVDEACKQIIADRDEYRKVFMSLEASAFMLQFTNDIMLPVNIQRVVESVFIMAKDTDHEEQQKSLTKEVFSAGLVRRIQKVKELCELYPYIYMNEMCERRRIPIPTRLSAAVTLLSWTTRAELSPNILAKITDVQLVYIIDAVRQRISSSLIAYGTAVGVLAAQSISEPLTQYMLDSHHRSVAGGTNKSGITRVAEIYGARGVDEEASPSMLLFLKQKNPTEAEVQTIANNIEYIEFRNIVYKQEIIIEVFSPSGDKLVYPETKNDAKWIQDFMKSHPLIRAPGDLTAWCLRFVIDKGALVLKAIDLELIVRNLRSSNPGTFVVCTAENAKEIVIRVWLRSTIFRRGASEEMRARDMIDQYMSTAVRGIPRIIHAVAEKVTRYQVQQDGSLHAEFCYAVKTVGTNLYRTALHPAIDPTQSISSSVGDTFEIFGIEAARNKIISETLAFMGSGAPNMRHLRLYADEMTRTGRVTSIERGGLSAREPGNILLRMAYGAPIQVVTDAALSGSRCKIYGVSAPQVLGSMPRIGTFYNSICVNEDFVRKNKKSVDSVLDELS